MKKSYLLLVAAGALGLVACAPDVTSSTTTSESPAPTVNGLSITNKDEFRGLLVGDTATIAYDLDASEGADLAVTFKSYDQTVATVTPSGLLTAIGEGSTSVVVASRLDSAVYDVLTVDVSEEVIPVTDLVAPETLLVYLGETAHLEVTVYPENATDKSLTYWSDDENIATIDENGLVTPVGEGEVALHALSGKVLSTTVLTVKPLQIFSVLSDIYDPEVNGVKEGSELLAAEKAGLSHVVFTSSDNQWSETYTEVEYDVYSNKALAGSVKEGTNKDDAAVSSLFYQGVVGDTFYDLTIDQTGYGETKATTKFEGAYTEDDYTLYGFPSVIYDGVTGALLNVIDNNRFTDTENVQYTITREGDVYTVNGSLVVYDPDFTFYNKALIYTLTFDLTGGRINSYALEEKVYDPTEESFDFTNRVPLKGVEPTSILTQEVKADYLERKENTRDYIDEFFTIKEVGRVYLANNYDEEITGDINIGTNYYLGAEGIAPASATEIDELYISKVEGPSAELLYDGEGVIFNEAGDYVLTIDSKLGGIEPMTLNVTAVVPQPAEIDFDFIWLYGIEVGEKSQDIACEISPAGADQGYEVYIIEGEQYADLIQNPDGSYYFLGKAPGTVTFQGRSTANPSVVTSIESLTVSEASAI